MTIIIKEGKRERDYRVHERARQDPNLRGKVYGIAHSADEANDISYHELRDRGDVQPILCEGGPETKQAFVDDMLRIHQDPDAVAHQWGLDEKKDG